LDECFEDCSEDRFEDCSEDRFEDCSEDRFEDCSEDRFEDCLFWDTFEEAIISVLRGRMSAVMNMVYGGPSAVFYSPFTGAKTLVLRVQICTIAGRTSAHILACV
jgi:hypothetical protein